MKLPCQKVGLDFTRNKPTKMYLDILKKLCNACPEKENCLATAMRNKEEAGVWGGLTPAERRELS